MDSVIGIPPPIMMSPVLKDQPQLPEIPQITSLPTAEADRVQMRQSILVQVREKIDLYSSLKTAWSVAYYVLGGLALLSNIIVLAMTSFSLSQYVTGEVNGFLVRDIIVTVCGAVAAITLSLNTILRSNMNATYFQEAVSKYKELEITVWSDLFATSNRLAVLNQTYDSAGVGTMLNFSNISDALIPNKKSKQGSGTPETKLPRRTVEFHEC
ncbi:hypothetical protein MP638_004656 [Amoeboaphelidium occidentale]|nr:hypothetical protein MP638_004656 [Amoeboaphelidium occidentale]